MIPRELRILRSHCPFLARLQQDTVQREAIMSFYDEIEIEDMTYHDATMLYTYPCPCGDQFEICLDDLREGEVVAICPSCSLQIKVIFELVNELKILAAFWLCANNWAGQSTKAGKR